jgi:hypothetical protein
VAKQVIDAFRESGRSFKIKQDYQLVEEDFTNGIDLVLSLGK